ncbi:MAG TPA: M23 family metallopeptidase [Myxococcaceae bacterium]|nr:M23 family metallopeptidase [Myxococcaceae bacterium]
MTRTTLSALLPLLLLAGTARAEPSFDVQPAKAKPGDPVLVTVRGVQTPPTGAIGDRQLKFYPVKRGFQAITGLPVEVAPGMLPVKLSVLPSKEASEPLELTGALEVVPPGYPAREIKVASQYVDAPPPETQEKIKADQEAFAKAYLQPFGPPLFEKDFAWPRPPNFTAPFGDQRMYNGKKQSQHFGTDFEGKVGAPITASNDGVVVLARSAFYSGNTVVLHHGAGLYTAYFHLSKFGVKLGDTVRQGQRIGLVGKTGRVTGPHLHWGVKVSDIYVDGVTLVKLLSFGGGPAQGGSAAESSGTGASAAPGASAPAAAPAARP